MKNCAEPNRDKCPHLCADFCLAKSKAKESLAAPTYSASPSDLLPPREIIESAATVCMWMEKMGYRNWQLGGICDRRFADEAKRLKSACDKWSEAETLHPLMHCQKCGELRGMDHPCDSLPNDEVARTEGGKK